MVTYIIRYWKEATILVLLALVNYYQFKPKPLPTVIRSVQTVEVEKIVEKVVTVATKQTKTTKKPDGTTTVTVTETATHADTHVAETVKQETKQTVDVPAAGAAESSRYSVTVLVDPREPKSFSADVGAQIGRLPVEGVIGFDRRDNSINLGLRARW